MLPKVVSNAYSGVENVESMWAQTFLFNNPLKKSKLLLSLCSCTSLPVPLSSHPSSSATRRPQSRVIPLILARVPPSVSMVTI